jgi:hypothetical protein
VANDLVAGRVEDRHLALEDRHERVVAIADAIEHIADVSGALLAECWAASAIVASRLQKAKRTSVGAAVLSS